MRRLTARGTTVPSSTHVWLDRAIDAPDRHIEPIKT